MHQFPKIFNELSYKSGIIIRGEQVDPRSLQAEVIGLAHECHEGEERTLKLLRQTCWFPGMAEQIKSYVSSCIPFNAAIPITHPEPLHPNLLPDRAWQNLHADFKEPIGAKCYLRVVIDQYSKCPEVDIVKSTSFDNLAPCLDRIFAAHVNPTLRLLCIKNFLGCPTMVDDTYPLQLSIRVSTTSDPEIVANHFGDFFASVADSVRSTIPPTNHHYSDFLSNQNQNSIFLAPTSPEEVTKIIGSFSTYKSTGPHRIPVSILQTIKHDISTPISMLINSSFEYGIFPTALKTSRVVPIFKKGSPIEVSNYLLISLLSNIEKIYEKVVLV